MLGNADSSKAVEHELIFFALFFAKKGRDINAATWKGRFIWLSWLIFGVFKSLSAYRFLRHWRFSAI
jgi:hypothetical protein